MTSFTFFELVGNYAERAAIPVIWSEKPSEVQMQLRSPTRKRVKVETTNAAAADEPDLDMFVTAVPSNGVPIQPSVAVLKRNNDANEDMRSDKQKRSSIAVRTDCSGDQIMQHISPMIDVDDQQANRERTDQALHFPELFNSFCVNLMAKVDQLLDYQKQQILLLKELVSKNQNPVDIQEDIFPKQLETWEELKAFNLKLCDLGFRKKMVIVLSAAGGSNVKETVRNVMKKLANNEIWSRFSMRGRRGKLEFAETRICRLVTRVCLKVHSGCSESKIESKIGIFLRYAPHHPGGSKYQAERSKIVIKKNVFSDDEGHSDISDGSEDYCPKPHHM